MTKGITKEQSKIIQGLAILMMLYHHLYADSQALGVSYYSVLNFGKINLELLLAYFFKICVGLYAFVSGYGLFISAKSNDSISNSLSFGKRLKEEYILIIKKLFSFYKSFWLVFIIFVPIGFIFFRRDLVLTELLFSFLGLSTVYNGAWWYVLQYVKMLLVFPFIDCFFVKFKGYKNETLRVLFYLIIGIVMVIVLFVNPALFMQIIDSFKPAYLLCFFSGYFISRFGLYELIINRIPSNFIFILGMFSLIVSISIRVILAKDPSWAKLDFILVPMFVFGFLNLISKLPKLGNILDFFGQYSTFMWLTHVFFYDHYAKSIVMFSHISTFIYLTLVALSLFSSMALNFLYRYFSKAFLSNIQ